MAVVHTAADGRAKGRGAGLQNSRSQNYTVIASEKGYISFQIPFYDDDGNNEYVRPGDGQLSVQIDSGEKKRS